LQNRDWLDQFNHPSDSLTGLIVSCYNLGCLGGCIINFFVGNWLGRRRAIWAAMGFVLVGATLQTTAYNVPHLIIGRVITGLGTGMKTSTVPMSVYHWAAMQVHELTISGINQSYVTAPTEVVLSLQKSSSSEWESFSLTGLTSA
jgi:MFS family permease